MAAERLKTGSAEAVLKTLFFNSRFHTMLASEHLSFWGFCAPLSYLGGGAVRVGLQITGLSAKSPREKILQSGTDVLRESLQKNNVLAGIEEVLGCRCRL